MVIIAGLILVGGWGLAYWGLCLVKGKNVTLAQMFNPLGNYPQFSGAFSAWPGIPNTQVFPGGAATKAASSSKTSTGSKTGACPPGHIRIPGLGTCVPFPVI